MSYIYRLAGENLELAEADLEGFLRSQGIDEEAERNGRLAFTEAEPGQLRRLAKTHEVSKLIERNGELETSYRPEGSFEIKAKVLEGDANPQEVEEKLGELLLTENNSVDLENPEEILRVYITEHEYIIGRDMLDIDRSLFNRRKNQKRPFSSPVSLDPELARLLVNLSEVPAGGKLFDPFCGTGGILIEAGLCGVELFGADIQKEMVSGTRENLEEYGVMRHDIREAGIEEVQDVFDREFDVIVTDLPYGKASKSEGEPAEKFLEPAPEMVDKTVFMYNEPELGGKEADFEIYVHKNLTRYIYILK